MKKICKYVFLWLCVVAYIGGYCTARQQQSSIKPVDIVYVDSIKIDSIKIVKDSIIYKTNIIKEIVYEEIEQANNLSDSAAVELFYKLLSN